VDAGHMEHTSAKLHHQLLLTKKHMLNQLTKQVIIKITESPLTKFLSIMTTLLTHKITLTSMLKEDHN